MKKILTMATALLFGVSLFAQMPPIPVDEAVRIGHLDNGLTYYIRHNEEPEGQANFYIAQKVGSILEEDSQRGLAHFLEHMCFNGTQNFPGHALINYLESIGVKFGEQLNAYTSIDETVYNIDNVPVVKVPTAIDSCLLILHDWAGALLLEDAEIDSERGVIHEEWRSRQNAQMRMYDKILPLVYPNNRYGERMPIGTMEVVDNFPYEVLRNYYHTWYRPDQQGIVVVGDVDVDLVEQKIIDIFSTLPAKAADAPERIYFPVENNPEPIVVHATDKEQPYAMTYIFAKHEAIPNEAKTTLDYALYQYVNYLIANMAEARLEEMSQKADPDFMGAGINDDDFFLSKTCDAFTGIAAYDEHQMLRAVTSVWREMLRIARHGFTASEYERARADYLTMLESAYNMREKKNSIDYCQEYVRHFIDNEPIPGIENEFGLMSQLAPNIPVEVVNQIAASFFQSTHENLVVCSMLPEKDDVVYPTDEELLAALDAVVAEDIEPYEDAVNDQPLVSNLRKAGKIKKSEEADFGYTKLTLSNKVKVYYKKTDYNKDQVIVNAFSKGGISLYPESDYITANQASELMTIGGVGNFNAVEINKALAGKKVGVTPYIGLTDEGIRASSTPKDLETLFQLTYLYFTAQRADQEAFTSWKTRTAASLKNAEMQPMTALRDSLTNTIYTNPAIMSDLKYNQLESVDYVKAMKIAKERFANAADFTFVITGNFDEETLKSLLCTYVASLPSKGKAENYNLVFDYRSGVNNVEFTKVMEDPMALNFFFFNAPAQESLRNELTLELLGSTLELVLHEEIREKEGGTYGIGATTGITTILGKSTLEIVYQCAPERYEYLNGRVDEIVRQFAIDGPAAEGIDKTKKNLAKTYEENLKENSYWATNLINELKYGVNFHDNYLETLESITADEIKACLNEILAAGNESKIVMVGTK